MTKQIQTRKDKTMRQETIIKLGTKQLIRGLKSLTLGLGVEDRQKFALQLSRQRARYDRRWMRHTYS